MAKRVRPGKKIQVNWLSEDELARFKAYASARGVSMTDLVREKISEFKVVAGKKPTNC